MSPKAKKAGKQRSDSSNLRKQFGRTKIREMREFRGEYTCLLYTSDAADE